MKILLVEDNLNDTDKLCAMLEEQGHEVVTAISGEDGVLLADELRPDLILMDVVMPGLNGFQATRQIKRCAGTRDIPVIIISSKSQAVDIVWGQRQGAEAYLVKPIGNKELAAAIEAATLIEPNVAI